MGINSVMKCTSRPSSQNCACSIFKPCTSCNTEVSRADKSSACLVKRSSSKSIRAS